jgi:hypothetical protein
MLCLTFKTSHNSFCQPCKFSWFIRQRSHKAGFYAGQLDKWDENKHNKKQKLFCFAVNFNSRRENTRTSFRERNKVQNHTDRGWAEWGEEAQSVVLCESKDQCVENDSGASTFFARSLSLGEKRPRAWHLCVNNSQTDALWAHQSGTARAIPAPRDVLLPSYVCALLERLAKATRYISRAAGAQEK